MTKIKGYGARVRRMRMNKGLSLQKMTNEIGLGYGTLRRLERELNMPNAYTIWQVAMYGDMTLDELISGSHRIQKYIPELELGEGIEKLGERVRRLRELRGKYQYEADADCGFKVGQFFRIESGIMARLDVIVRVADYFNVTLDYLTNGWMVKGSWEEGRR